MLIHLDAREHAGRNVVMNHRAGKHLVAVVSGVRYRCWTFPPCQRGGTVLDVRTLDRENHAANFAKSALARHGAAVVTISEAASGTGVSIDHG